MSLMRKGLPALLSALIVAMGFLSWGPAGLADDEAPAAPPRAGVPDEPFVEITPELLAVVDKGLAYLATQQNEDGSFPSDRYGKNVGVTALCGIAFMAHGDLPGRGKYAKVVEKTVDFILNKSQKTGLISADPSQGPMYGHGFATLMLAEVYGQTGDKRIREALVKAVQLIVTTQNFEGGWRYQPVAYQADLSVTICQIMALRAARNAGIKVPKVTIDRAIQYVRQSQNWDGGFRYMLNHSGGSAFARSAAGLASLYYAGIYNDKALDSGLAYLLSFTPGTVNSGSTQNHYFYGHYYAVQAMYLAGGKYWRNWFPAIRAELIEAQTSNGGFWDGQAGRAYGTAMALIVLQMPNRYLPIFQK